jgi:hypothetical protein
VIDRVQLRPRESERKCSVCFGSDDELTRCHRCGTLCHLECFTDVGARCPTLGCADPPPTLGRLLSAYEVAQRRLDAIPERRAQPQSLGAREFREVFEVELRNARAPRTVALALSLAAFFFALCALSRVFG